MPGVSIHNLTITQKPWEWSVSPMYSFNTEEVNGFAIIRYTQNGFQAGIKSQRFSHIRRQSGPINFEANYEMVEPYLQFTLRPELSRRSQSMVMRFLASYQVVYFHQVQSGYSEGDIRRTVNQEALKLDCNTTFSPGPFDRFLLLTSARLNANIFEEQSFYNRNVGNFFSATLEYRHMYSKRRKKYAEVRAFYGTTGENTTSLQRYNPAGMVGASDLFFDGLYLGRSEDEGLMSRQIINEMGMLRTPSPVYFQSMVAMNVDIDFPIPFPLVLSLNAVADSPNNLVDEDQVFTSVVLSVPIVRDVLEFHFPVLYSSNLKTYYDSAEIGFADRIMFTLRLDAMSPFSILRNIEP